MKFEYFPADIVNALASVASETDPEILENATGAIYDLKAICENPYNSDYYKDLYRLLEKVTDKIENNRR